jgi:hypothetical protein
MTVDRRRSERHSAGWAAEFRLDERDPWRRCRVIDVSFEGAAVELSDVTVTEGVDGPLQLRISSAVDQEHGILLRTVVRRIVELEGRVIAGVEFSVLRSEERSLLHLLVGLRTLD